MRSISGFKIAHTYFKKTSDVLQDVGLIKYTHAYRMVRHGGGPIQYNNSHLKSASCHNNWQHTHVETYSAILE